MKKCRVGVVGGAGMTGGEVIRLLLAHPGVDLAFASSRSQVGKPVSSVHEDLVGQTSLTFTDAYRTDVDAVFLCLPHGHSREYLQKVDFDPKTIIIDLSNDFRLNRSSEGFIYGLPELQKEHIEKAVKIANPGCFATAIQLALLPLAHAGKLQEDVHVSAITGSTGAGAAQLPTTHFSWRNNNVSVYKVFKHQHLGEINESVVRLQPSFQNKIHFVPYRGNFTRGIIATSYTAFSGTLESAKKLYEDYYADSPFVHVSDGEVHLKQVVNTNLCMIQLGLEDGRLYVVSVIDNLLKGAAGQAVQNLNLIMGWPEDLGLKLKASVY